MKLKLLRKNYFNIPALVFRRQSWILDHVLDDRLSGRVIFMWIMIVVSGSSFALRNYAVVVESGTSVAINNLNLQAKKDEIADKPVGKVVEWTALQLLNQPYELAPLDRKTPEYLYISLTNTDCMLFIEEVLATSKLIKQHDLNLPSLTNEIVKLRYHGAISYCDRNHYFKDWAFVNIKNGFITDEGLNLTGINSAYNVSSMSTYLSHHNDLHSSDLKCILSREAFINQNEKIGFIPLKDLDKSLRKIKSGDIIGIIRTPKGRADSIHHLGIAYVHDGVISMIHASSEYHKVIISPTLKGYLERFKDSQGIVLFRPQEYN